MPPRSLRYRERDLALEVEVVLPAGADRARQAVRRACERLGRIAARHVHRRQHERLGGERLVDRQERRQRLDVDARERRRAARGV